MNAGRGLDLNQIGQVAARAGVSISTVSRVFNRTATVKEATRRRVLDAARELNYQPKIVARRKHISLLVSSSRRVALAAFEAEILGALTERLIAEETAFEIVPSSQIDMLEASLPAGIIAILHVERLLEPLLRLKHIPIVTINSRIRGLPSVNSDHRQGVADAVKFLQDRGHARIGLVLNSQASWGSAERAAGFRDAIGSKRLSDELLLTLDGREMLDGLPELLEKSPTALVFASEDMAIKAYHALAVLGLRIPDDLSVITMATETVRPYLLPAPTELRQPMDELARCALDVLQSRIDHPKRKLQEQPLLPNQIISRDSVRDLR